MPKIRCICDRVIWLGDIPCRDEYLIISDVEFDDFHGQIDAESIFTAMEIVVKCPDCGRLHIFWDGFDKPQTIYQIER